MFSLIFPTISLSILLPTLLASPLPLPTLSTAAPLSKDYTSLGHLLALNASSPYFPGVGPVTGCITSSFKWTLDTTACATFDGTRMTYNKNIGMFMYDFVSEAGQCGLLEGGKVACGDEVQEDGKWSAPNSTVPGTPLYMMGWANWPVQNWPSKGVDVDVWNTLVDNPAPGVVLQGFKRSFSVKWQAI
ncbi:hypothetical protein CJF32_00009882 [Rutstroemia sp. NJR-2017a WRK4]|nr:hypothetical protein CJF32_00009882 [Rutstroemia sp. NJR-2017a WRK4]